MTSIHTKPGQARRIALVSLALGHLLAAQVILAQTLPLRLGDLDADGRPTVLDLQRLINHLNGTATLNSSLRPFGDLNEDGVVDTNDLVTLRSAILGLGVLPNPFSAPVVSAPVNSTNGTNILIIGTARPHRTIYVQGGAGVFTAVADSNGLFSVAVTLQSNRVNNLFLTASNGTFTAGTPQPLRVLQDSDPPSLFIDFPTNGQTLFTSNTLIAGRVGDLLSGFQGLNVNVTNLTWPDGGTGTGGGIANVDVGIGNNGTFERSVPLVAGSNTIQVIAQDSLGNSTNRQIICIYQPPVPGQPLLLALSGDLQETNVHRRLGRPVVIKVAQADGTTPVINKVVDFEITRSDGRLSPVDASRLVNPSAFSNDITRTVHGVMHLQLLTDVNGEARAWWAMGGDAGRGNNRLCVMSSGISNALYFCASANPAAINQINIGTGNNQKAEVGGEVAEPLRAWVSDSCNGIPGVPVTFTVVRGDGRLFSTDTSGGEGRGTGAAFLTVTSSITGHAEALLTLGPDAGANVIEANYAGNPGRPATFICYGVARDPSRPTAFTGLILDNASQPVGGAWVRLFYSTPTGNTPLYSTYSDARGRFQFSGVLPGSADLNVLGSYANTLGTNSIPFGTFPSLSFRTILIPNAENSLPRPILLPRLNTNNARLYYGTNDLMLTCEGIDGLKMTIKANSMRDPQGIRVAPDHPMLVSLNQVHHDSVPMPMPDGASPAFAWTLQPGGSKFDPPVQIEYPNMSGLPAGTVAYFLSYNHDTERFEIVASSHVQPDSATIVTDPGAGLTIAGWGCNCPPYSVTGDCQDCPLCSPCEESCWDRGRLFGGAVLPIKQVVCQGDDVTFTFSGTTDFAGSKVRNCNGELESIPIPPVAPIYSWKITRDGVGFLEGTGPGKTIPHALAGEYVCTVYASVSRECAPSPIFVGTATATVVGLEKLIVSDFAHPSLSTAVTSPGMSADLILCESLSGDAVILLNAEFTPASDLAQARVLWEVEGAVAERVDVPIPVHKGNFLGSLPGVIAVPKIKLTPTGSPPNRTFTVRVGCDANGDGTLDLSEVTHTVRVVVTKVDSLTVSDHANPSINKTATVSGELYAPQPASGDASISLHVNLPPGTPPEAGAHVFYKVQTPGTRPVILTPTPPSRNFGGTDPVVPLPLALGRVFDVYVGCDENNNGELDVPEEWTQWITVNVIKGDLQIIKSDGLTPLSEAEEESPGGFVAVNNDDDDYNGTTDNLDAGAVSGENDLLKIHLSPITPTSAGGVYTLLFPSPKIKIWSAADKSGTPINSTTTEIDATADTTLWVEGIARSDIAAAEKITLNWAKHTSGSSAVLTDLDRVNFTVYEVTGPINVPGYSKHLYKAEFPGTPSGTWTVINGTATAGPDPTTVNVLWGGGPAIGKPQFSPSPGFVSAHDVNIVQVTVDPPALGQAFSPGTPVDPLSLTPPNSPFVLGPSGVILRTIWAGPFINGIPGLAWQARVSLAGPSGHRGVESMRIGFVQVLVDYQCAGTYNGIGLPRQLSRHAASLLPVLDYDNNHGTPMPPYYFVDTSLPGGGSTVFFDASPARLAKTLIASDTPTQGPPYTFEQTTILPPPAGQDTVDAVSLLNGFDLYVIAATTDTANGANGVYTARAKVHWAFDGSGTFDSAGSWIPGGSAGVTTTSMNWLPVTDGSTPQVTSGGAANVIINALPFNP